MDLVEVARFLDPTEAQAAASALRASGMHVHVQNEHYGQTVPYLQLALGGFGLYAPAADVADARAFIAAARADARPTLPETDTAADRAVSTLAIVLTVFGGGLLGWLVAPFARRHRRLDD